MGLTASEGTAKEHGWKGCCHLHQANVLEAKARGRQKLSDYTQKAFEISNSFACCFQFKNFVHRVVTVLLKLFYKSLLHFSLFILSYSEWIYLILI